MRLRKIVAAVASAALCTGGLMALTTGVAQSAPPSSTADVVQPYIIGGEAATEDYPFYVKLFAGTRFMCGGSLIASTWVVTADHCLGGITSVRIGGTTLTGGETIRVNREIGHSRYDIGLLRLATPSRNTPIKITSAALDTGIDVRIMGHGQTCPVRGCGSAPQQLMQLDTTLVNTQGCTAGFSGTHELCVGDNQGAGACYGDSGGPLVVRVNDRWELGGATSRAGQNQPTCAEAPSIYTKVPQFKSWIQRYTGPLS